MPRRETERSIPGSPPAWSSDIPRIEPEELASRIWNEGTEWGRATPGPEHQLSRGGEGGSPRDDPSPETAARRRVDAYFRARAREARDLRASVDALSTAVGELRNEVVALRDAGADPQQDQVLTGLRVEVAGMAERLEGLGKPRTAPRLSKEVDALTRRLGSLEKAVATDIPRSIARAVDLALERRFGKVEGEGERDLENLIALRLDRRPEGGAERASAP